jgi:hypothetical protein
MPATPTPRGPVRGSRPVWGRVPGGLRIGGFLIGSLLLAPALVAQPGARRATNLAALLNYPSFFQLRPVLVVGDLKLHDTGELRVSDESGSLRVVFRGSTPDGLAEVRGEFWDIGRMRPDDPRLGAYDLRQTFQMDPEAGWPRPGQVMAIVASVVTGATAPTTASIRNMVLFPDRFRDQKVTIVGQFAGRNLLGDLPDAPARSRYDFVLRSADAAVWVANLRPRGRDFELALDARIDTGRWLEVTGVLEQGRGLQWLDGEAGSLKIVKPPADAPEETPVAVPPAPPPEVIFSAPTEGETDVSTSTTLRIQFSRDINPGTLKGRLRVAYEGAGGQAPDAIEFTTEYRPAARVLEVTFAKPLAALRTVRVALPETVLGTDRQPLKPWTLTFTIGAQ